MGRRPCCDKSKVKRGPWSCEEDTTLKNYVHKHGTAGSWIALPKKAGLKRCGKSCRLRWLNYLRPDIKHGGFTQQEDTIILTLYHNIGRKWSLIASQLQGRTDNDVKNYWNTKLKNKLFSPAHAPGATITDTNPASASASTTSSSFISSTNGDVEAAYSRNSEFDVDTMMMLPSYFPVDHVNSYQQNLSSQISQLPGLSTEINHANRLCEDDDAFKPLEFGCGLMTQPYDHDLLNACNYFHENFDHEINHCLSFGEQEQQAIYQSFTY